MNIELTQDEARVIGCLMEKAVTTPDQYPLSLNALMNACNQKSSREPVMAMDQGQVQRTARQLHESHLVSQVESAKSNVERYSQRLCNTTLGECQFDSAQYAIVTLLLLRGSQTPGELKARAGRLHQFSDNHEVSQTLDALMTREGGAIVARLPRQQGRQDHQYTHLFYGDVESVSQEVFVERAPQVRSSASDDLRVEALEARVEKLEAALTNLAATLGETVEF